MCLFIMHEKWLLGLLCAVALMHFGRASPLQVQLNDKSVNIRPKHYGLNIQIFPEEETFSGEVVINVVCLEATNVITLNANKTLKIQDVHVVKTEQTAGAGQNEELKIHKIEGPDDRGLLNIILHNTLAVRSESEIKITFSGKLNTENTNGLFKKTYVDSITKETKWIIGSKFKPNLTSSAFPCFDGRFRAPFDVTIQRPSKVNSLSTMPLLRSVDMGTGWTKDVFVATPPMAPFSVAIFVSDLTPVLYNKPDLQIRIWPAPEVLQAVKHNKSDVIYNALKRYEEIYGVKYPLSKLDYIALPTSLGIDVSSSWGLIISSTCTSESNSEMEEWSVSNEIGKQWIGNLLTTAIPAEESSAVALGVAANLQLDFAEKVKQNEAISPDWPTSSLYSTIYELATPKPRDDPEIRRMVNSSKDYLLYRMLSYLVTEQTYYSTLKNFIKDKQFKTFQLAEFWEALTKQAHLDGTLQNDITVKEIVTAWFANYRMPFVTVTRNYNGESALLKQEIFIRKRPRAVVKEKDLLWNIPIVMTTQNKLDFSNTKPKYWLKEKELTIKNIAGSNEFVIVNLEEIGIFVVNYDKTNWNMLANFLQVNEQRKKIPPVTRAKIIHDALNLAYAGHLDFGTALNVTLFLKDEMEYVVWRPFFIMFDHLARHVDGTNAHKKYQTFVRILVKSLKDRINAPGAKHNSQTNELLREIESILRNIGNEASLTEANTAYEKWMRNPNANYASVSKYLCPIFEFGTDKQWEFGLKTLKNIKEYPEIERGYLFKTVVGCTVDRQKIKKFLKMTLFEQKDVFTDDDSRYALSMLTGGTDGYMATFEYLDENWDGLKDRLKNKPDIWESLIYTATNLFKTQEGLDKITKFYEKHRGQFGGAESTIQQGIEKCKEEAKWTNENLNTFEDWLDNFILTNTPQN